VFQLTRHQNKLFNMRFDAIARIMIQFPVFITIDRVSLGMNAQSDKGTRAGPRTIRSDFARSGIKGATPQRDIVARSTKLKGNFRNEN
jgi:hypothetical protein